MRERRERCVVTFRTTTGAMEMERSCEETGLPGRLILVPRAITAGCGMCSAAPPEAREAREELAVKKRWDDAGVSDIIIWEGMPDVQYL